MHGRDESKKRGCLRLLRQPLFYFTVLSCLLFTAYCRLPTSLSAGSTFRACAHFMAF